MGLAGASAGGGVPAPPSGFTTSTNPALAQNPSSGEVAHLDPLTNSWSVSQVPTDFQPDPAAPGQLTYVNPVTGQHLQYVGYDWWVDPIDHSPPIFHYDPTTGRTAYFNPTTTTWTVPSPPPGYVVDTKQPSSRLGYVFTTADGTHSAIYGATSGSWIDADTLKPLPAQTVERSGTGGEAGRVTLPDATQITGPSQDSKEDEQGKDSQYSSHLMALRRGNTSSVPFNAPSYQADLKNLEETKALRAKMAAEGAGQLELDIVDNHIRDLERYLGLWEDHYDNTGKLVYGSATAVNDAALMDDFSVYAAGTVNIVIEGTGVGVAATEGAVMAGSPSAGPVRLQRPRAEIQKEHASVMRRIEQRANRLNPRIKRLSRLRHRVMELNQERSGLPIDAEHNPRRAQIDAELNEIRGERAQLSPEVNRLLAEDQVDTQRAVELSRELNPPTPQRAAPAGPSEPGMNKQELDNALREGSHLRGGANQVGDTMENTQPMTLPPPQPGGGQAGLGGQPAAGGSGRPVAFTTPTPGGPLAGLTSFLGRGISNSVTPIGGALLGGLTILGIVGGANGLGSPAHVVQVPVNGGQAAPASAPAGPLAVSPVNATLSPDGQSTTFAITVTNVTGFAGTSWSMVAPKGAPDCNHMTFSGDMAVWHHGAADGCGPVLGGSAGIDGQLTVSVNDGSGFRCTATYSGSLSGTGPPSTCKGGGPTQNPNQSFGSTLPTSTLVSETVPASLSVPGGVLGGIFGLAVGIVLLGAGIPTGRRRTVETKPAPVRRSTAQEASSPVDAAAPPKPIMPAAEKKRKKRSCQLELDALNRADRALQRARAAARAADGALADALAARDGAQSAKAQADATLNTLTNPQPGQSVDPVQEGKTFQIRAIVRHTDNTGAPAAPTADDVGNVDASFSHAMTIGEAQRADDKASADLEQAQATLAAAQAAAKAADGAVDAAVKAYEQAREAYGKCVQEQREGI